MVSSRTPHSWESFVFSSLTPFEELRTPGTWLLHSSLNGLEENLYGTQNPSAEKEQGNEEETAGMRRALHTLVWCAGEAKHATLRGEALLELEPLSSPHATEEGNRCM